MLNNTQRDSLTQARVKFSLSEKSSLPLMGGGGLSENILFFVTNKPETAQIGSARTVQTILGWLKLSRKFSVEGFGKKRIELLVSWSAAFCVLEFLRLFII